MTHLNHLGVVAAASIQSKFGLTRMTWLLWTKTNLFHIFIVCLSQSLTIQAAPRPTKSSCLHYLRAEITGISYQDQLTSFFFFQICSFSVSVSLSLPLFFFFLSPFPSPISFPHRFCQKKKDLSVYFCVCIVPMHVCVHHMCAWCLRRTESVGFPGTGDAGGSELADVGAGS